LPPELPVEELPADTELWRVHRLPRRALRFGTRGEHRFSAPGGEFGTCYLGDSLQVSILETFIRGSRYRMISGATLRAYAGSSVRTALPARLLRLHSDGLVALGLPADAPHRIPYTDCQALAVDAWRCEPPLDGIRYRSRWDDALYCVALFDRARSALGPPDAPLRMDDLSLIRPILRQYDIRIV
jgi:hypothetical protein